MSISFNTHEINSVNYNGVELNDLTYNGVHVLESGTLIASGIKIDSGVSVVPPPYDSEGYNYGGNAPLKEAEIRNSLSPVLPMESNTVVAIRANNKGSWNSYGGLNYWVNVREGSYRTDNIDLFFKNNEDDEIIVYSPIDPLKQTINGYTVHVDAKSNSSHRTFISQAVMEISYIKMMRYRTWYYKFELEDPDDEHPKVKIIIGKHNHETPFKEIIATVQSIPEHMDDERNREWIYDDDHITLCYYHNSGDWALERKSRFWSPNRGDFPQYDYWIGWNHQYNPPTDEFYPDVIRGELLKNTK